MDIINYLKIPYKHQGRDLKGADCFGLLRLFYKNELGIELPDFTENYSQEWWLQKNYFIDLYKQWNFARTEAKNIGNVILFNNSNNIPGHVGIIVNSESFIHMARVGCSVQPYVYGAWARQIHSIYEYKE